MAHQRKTPSNYTNSACSFNTHFPAPTSKGNVPAFVYCFLTVCNVAHSTCVACHTRDSNRLTNNFTILIPVCQLLNDAPLPARMSDSLSPEEEWNKQQ